jgi:hypothetical protein
MLLESYNPSSFMAMMGCTGYDLIGLLPDGVLHVHRMPWCGCFMCP